MPKYKKRDPEIIAVQFTGSNIQEVMDELGPLFATNHRKDLKDATTFTLAHSGRAGLDTVIVNRDEWIAYTPDTNSFLLYLDSEFHDRFETVKRVGRPAKEKK